MDTQQFLGRILPSQGIYVLAEFRRGLNNPPYQSTHTTIDSLAAAAQAQDHRGVNVYHACASFGELREKHMRAADNAAYARALWLDLDCGEGKPYATQADAVRAMAGAVHTLKLPLPMLVSSGRGVHAYWPFNRDVAAKTWVRVATAFRAAIESVGVQHDASRTCDVSSILRPIGTHWRKTDTPRPVKLLRDTPDIDPLQIINALQRWVPPPPSTVPMDDGLTVAVTYPPSSAVQIIQFCPSLANIAARQGDVSEPEWRGMLGILKHTTEGDDLAHEWSIGHPDYDYDKTQNKLDGWHTGPTTCAEMRKHCTDCTDCTRAVKSPIMLGYTADNPPVAAPAPDPDCPLEGLGDEVPTGEDALPDQWPKGFGWNGYAITKAVQVPNEPDTHVPFCRNLVWLVNRVRLTDGTWRLVVRALIGKEPRTFDIPTGSLADVRVLHKALADHEVMLEPGPKGAAHMADFLGRYLDKLVHQQREIAQRDQFGWNADFTEFVIGDRIITPKGTLPVLPGKRLEKAGMCVDYGRHGTADTWAGIIDEVFNRPGAEPYQFLIAAAFGSPLIAMLGSPNWHGIPIALTGESGVGKTTTAVAACSMYGVPERFKQDAGANGTTYNAINARLAITRNLPMVMDELTGRPANEVGGLLYSMANGRPKDRGTIDGGLQANNGTWDMFTFMTSNTNINSLLGMQESRDVTLATSLRVFEIVLPPNFNERIFRGTDVQHLLEHDLVRCANGTAGEEYIQYLMTHRESVVKTLQKYRKKMVPNSQDERRERFYRDTVMTAMVGAAIATKLGLIKFDLKALEKWATDNVVAMRAMRSSAQRSPDEYIASLLRSLHGRTLVTERMRANPPQAPKEEMRYAPVARVASKDRVFLLAVSYLREFCQEAGVNLKWLVDQLDQEGYIIHRAGDADAAGRKRARLSTGTTYRLAPEWVYELDFSKINHEAGAPAGGEDMHVDMLGNLSLAPVVGIKAR